MTGYWGWKGKRVWRTSKAIRPAGLASQRVWQASGPGKARCPLGPAVLADQHGWEAGRVGLAAQQVWQASIAARPEAWQKSRSGSPCARECV
jgi:hypothetical protein